MVYITITGGVISGLGKGILAASIAQLLKIRMNLNVGIIKIDPYLNRDSGLMSPEQHGEVFVTEDGKETDLDLGHYERFMDENLKKDSCVTMGTIMYDVICSERKGTDDLGNTYQIVPHVTNEIKSKIELISDEKDVVIIEVGGTIGDLESNSILFALKELETKNKCIHIHLSKLDYETGYLKTKPIQNSIIELGRHSILPDILVVRSYKTLTENEKEHIKCKLRNKVKYILYGETVDNIYDLPMYFESQNILSILALKMGISHQSEKIEFQKAKGIINEKYKIAIANKYGGIDQYISLQEAIKHIEINENIKIQIHFVNIDEFVFREEVWKDFDGIIIPGAFGSRGMENKISVCKYARENKIPILGLCMGMQIMCIEYARNVCGIKNATSEEFENEMVPAPEYIIHKMSSQNYIKQLGGTMRLGAFNCNLMCDSVAYSAYNSIEISERHRHRYEFNNEYKSIMEENGFRFTGFNTKLDVIEIVELDTETHPFFVGVQFHPEFKSRPNRPHPLFREFLKIIKDKKKEVLYE